MLADRQKQNSSQLKQLRSLTVDKSWNAEKRIVFPNLFPQSTVRQMRERMLIFISICICLSKSFPSKQEADETQNADLYLFFQIFFLNKALWGRWETECWSCDNWRQTLTPTKYCPLWNYLFKYENIYLSNQNAISVPRWIPFVVMHLCCETANKSHVAHVPDP